LDEIKLSLFNYKDKKLNFLWDNIKQYPERVEGRSRGDEGKRDREFEVNSRDASGG
jgi:hypothetical protein